MYVQAYSFFLSHKKSEQEKKTEPVKQSYRNEHVYKIGLSVENCPSSPATLSKSHHFCFCVTLLV